MSDSVEPDPWDRDDPSRGESVATRIDRNWSELLQELRVTQTGVQILFAFLLTIPFQAGFATLTDVQRVWYLIVLGLITFSSGCLLAPVIAHRVLFRQRLKDVLLRFGDRLTKVGLAALSVSLSGAVCFIVELVLGRVASMIALGVTLLAVVALWWLVPAHLRRRGARGPHY